MDRQITMASLFLALAVALPGCSSTSQFAQMLPSFSGASHVDDGCAADGCTGEDCLVDGKGCTSEGCSSAGGMVSVERGSSNIVLDGVGWVVGIPSKLLLFNRNIDNHDVSPETENTLRKYLIANDLSDVKVRINQYDPIGEWGRLRKNKSIHAGWRYTVGVFATARYTIFPGRILGGDEYNPFTNTISLYSDRPSIALREGAHAKLADRAPYRGLLSSSMFLPGSPLWIDTPATRDVLAYSRETKQRALERDVYQVLFPAYGSRLGQSLVLYMDFGESRAIEATFALAGHAVGRVMAASVSDDPMQMAKSLSGFAKRKARPKPEIDSIQNPLPPESYPVRFESVDVIYQPIDSI